MDAQLSFASLDFAGKKKRTKRDGPALTVEAGINRTLQCSMGLVPSENSIRT